MGAASGKKSQESTGAACLFVAAVFFLFSFQAPWALRANPQSDEGCYLATLGQILSFDVSTYCQRPNYYAHGVSWLWLPGGWLGLALGRLTELDPFQWAIPVISIYSFCLFGAAVYLLSLWPQIKRFSKSGRHVTAVSVILLLNAPILYYATHWTLMPHTAELALALLLVFLLKNRRWFLALVSGLVLVWTRYNDVPALLLILGALIDARAVSRKWTIAVASVSAAVAFWVAWLAFVIGYGGVKLTVLFHNLGFPFLEKFLFGNRWGIFWMEPWWLVVIGLGLISIHRLSWMARGALLWMLIETGVCIAWDGSGGDFGYRYMIGAHAGAILVALEAFEFLRPTARKAMAWFTVVGALWMTYLTFVYRTIGALSPQGVFDPSGNVIGLLGVPDFFNRAIRHSLDPAVYRSLISQQIPWITLYHSLYGASDPGYKNLVLEGPPLAVLTFIVFLSTTYGVLYLLRWLRGPRQLC